MSQLKVADEAWLATALLHRTHPEREDFKLAEIRQRAMREFNDDRPGVWYHLVWHCVASKKPSPASHRMLHETGRGRRRLFRPSDPFHPGRRTGKTRPDKNEIPQQYWPLLEWYDSEYIRTGPTPSSNPAVLVVFAGAIAAYDLNRITDAIREGCEQVDPSGW